MFVKIRYSDIIEKRVGFVKSALTAEHVYDCNHYSLFPTKPVPPAADETEMNLAIEFNKSGPCGWDRTVSFPCESETSTVEIFVMNEHGKTVDRYSY